MGAFIIGGFIVVVIAVILTFAACAAVVISELWSARPANAPLPEGRRAQLVESRIASDRDPEDVRLIT